MNEASKRAVMPKGTNAVLDRRTVYHSNSNLLDIVKPGDSYFRVPGLGTYGGPVYDAVSESSKRKITEVV